MDEMSNANSIFDRFKTAFFSIWKPQEVTDMDDAEPLNFSFEVDPENFESFPVIVDYINEQYEDQLEMIRKQVGPNDGYELQVQVLSEWVTSLRETCRDLIKAVKALLIEVEGRPTSSRMEEQGSPENQEETTCDQLGEKMQIMKNDMGNLLEIIRRAREEQKWDANGLIFHTLNGEDIFGKPKFVAELTPRRENLVNMEKESGEGRKALEECQGQLFCLIQTVEEQGGKMVKMEEENNNLKHTVEDMKKTLEKKTKENDQIKKKGKDEIQKLMREIEFLSHQNDDNGHKLRHQESIISDLKLLAVCDKYCKHGVKTSDETDELSSCSVSTPLLSRRQPKSYFSDYSGRKSK